MNRDLARRVRADILALAGSGLDWVGFATATSERLQRAIGFQRSCWHLVDPGTVLFTGSLNRDVPCSGSWLAEHEYIIDDVNQWWFLARSGRTAGATSIATHGDLTRCVRSRSHQAIGIGDELRGALVADGAYWGGGRIPARRGRSVVHRGRRPAAHRVVRGDRRGPAPHPAAGQRASGTARAWAGRSGV